MASDLPISVSLAAVATTLALAFIFFLYAVGLRIAHVLHKRSMCRLRDRWWPVFGRAAMESGESLEDILPRRRLFPRAKLLREWCRFRAHIRGNFGGTFDQLAEALGLTNVARRLLKKASTHNKLLAIQALGFLRDQSSWNSIQALITHRNISISVTAATSLIHIDAERAIPLLIPLISERTTWPRTQIGRMLGLAGPKAVTVPLCLAIENAQAEQAVRLFRFYESACMSDIDSLIAKILMARSDPALCAAALKAVRGHLPGPTIARLAKHQAWFVRMQVANVLGRLGRREDYRILEPLLSDDEWWVRYRAAQAIVKLPFLGPNALRKLCNRQSDRYARDILRQALAEAGLS